MTDVSNRPRPWWENGTVSASLLTLVVLAVSLASDKWVPNSQLTLPLLISTAVSAVVAAAGIPRLKSLKMGQVIGQSDRTGSRPASEPYGPENLLATVLHTVFDANRIRITPELLPPELSRTILEGKPIKELF